MRVLVLGAGKMVQSILLGLKDIEDLSQWMIFSPSGTSAQKLAELVGAQHIVDLDLALTVEYVLVGCKPQQLGSLKKTIGQRFHHSLFISLMAAVSEKDQKKILEVNSLIRCMPNLPVQFRKGVILLASDSAPEKIHFFQSFFSKLGTSLIVSEKDLEDLTLLTGSGPALFYEFAKHLSESFESLDQFQREALTRAVFIGAAKSVEQDQSSLVDLTHKVTSKGGVTIAILECWRDFDFSGLVRKGINRGRTRTKDIKDQIQS